MKQDSFFTYKSTYKHSLFFIFRCLLYILNLLKSSFSPYRIGITFKDNNMENHIFLANSQDMNCFLLINFKKYWWLDIKMEKCI